MLFVRGAATSIQANEADASGPATFGAPRKEEKQIKRTKQAHIIIFRSRRHPSSNRSARIA